jgi:hypothetical protein
MKRGCKERDKEVGKKEETRLGRRQKNVGGRG